MKVYISYFYQIRNFDKYIIPLSTAMFDPKWYHDNQESTHLFWDKNGVINGLRCYQLIFNHKKYNDWCGSTCAYKDKTPLCPYLNAYRRMLGMIEWSNLMEFFKSSITYVASHNKDLDNIDKYNVCLIVYETPTNPCSERRELIKWFKEQGVDLIEWDKDLDSTKMPEPIDVKGIKEEAKKHPFNVPEEGFVIKIKED